MVGPRPELREEPAEQLLQDVRALEEEAGGWDYTAAPGAAVTARLLAIQDRWNEAAL